MCCFDIPKEQDLLITDQSKYKKHKNYNHFRFRKYMYFFNIY
jgi:hypothetical protein